MNARYLKALSVLVAICVFGVVSTASASAAPHWRIGGSQFLGEETISSRGELFTLEVPKRGVTLKCTVESGVGKIYGGNQDEGTINFSICSLVGGEAFCKVADVPRFEAHTELIEVGGKVYDKFTPNSGTVFTTITISGAECSAAGTFPVTGNIAGEVGPEAVENTLTFSKAISQTTGTELGFGTGTGVPAFLNGVSRQKLTGANKGKTLGAK